MGTLYLVSTPIGNLEDITLRALRILGEVSLIAAEDTRRTRQLLSHYAIKTETTSFHEHNKFQKIESILVALSRGDVALVSDAGTPVLNDPGIELITRALEAGFEVSPVPGANAPITALVASGLSSEKFLYLGYLPRRTNDRRALLASLINLPYTLIFLETPQRLLSALSDLKSELGDRQIAIGRELTKLYEEIFRGKISEAIAHYTENTPRGEFTLVLAGGSPAIEEWSESEVQTEIRLLMEKGVTATEIAKGVSTKAGWPRRKVYKMVNEIQLL